LLAQARPPAAGKSTPEIDASVWKPIAAAVAAHDIAALGRTYHPAAVLVMPTGTLPIAKALDGWGRDMAAARAAGTRAVVELRFSERMDDAETAFESGIFRYASTPKGEKEKPRFVRFEALLIKSGGQWLMVMERQLGDATEAAWNALGR
jgi:ketosteroid isomerase-like protein